MSFFLEETQEKRVSWQPKGVSRRRKRLTVSILDDGCSNKVVGKNVKGIAKNC